jgi:thymidylate synthase
MRIYSGESFSEVYEQSLRDLHTNPEYTSNPRGLNIKENLGVALEILDPLSCLYDNSRRGSQSKYIAAELIWYFLGRNDVEFIKKFASFWESIQNEDGTVNSSYGYLLFKNLNRFGFSQYQWAINCLKNDLDSRQAIMHFNLPQHQYVGNKDFVCTMYGIWQIRDYKLNLTIHMRSNDAILGTPTDIAFFTVLQQQALNHLRYYHPGLKLGSYTHIVDSYHVYERNFNLVSEMLENEFKPVKIPTLSKNLISHDGSPSTDLKILSDHMESGFSTEDKLMSWISKSINK